MKVAEAVGAQVVKDLQKAFAPFCGDVKERVDEWLEENLAGDNKSPATEKAYGRA